MQIPRASSTKARGPGGQARRLWVLGGGGGPAVSRPHASHADGVRLNGSAAAAETLLTGLKGVQAVSQPAGLMPPASARLSLPTVPAGLEPAASAAQPRAQRRLPIDPPGLQPSGSAQPQPPPPTLDQPQLAAPPPQLAASATTREVRVAASIPVQRRPLTQRACAMLPRGGLEANLRPRTSKRASRPISVAHTVKLPPSAVQLPSLPTLGHHPRKGSSFS